ncbi:MAG: hypothetical protein Q9207_006307 [Kuettlingeria erythrocarpa]
MATSNIQCNTRRTDLRKPLSPLPAPALNTRRPSGPSNFKHRAKKTCQDTSAPARHTARQSSVSKPRPRVPQTKPDEVQELWAHVVAELYRAKVMSQEQNKRRTRSGASGSKGKQKGTLAQSGVPSASASSFDLLGSVGDDEVESALATVTSNGAAASKRIGPYNTNFRSSVLAPRGISFKLAQDFTSPWQHFGSAAPKSNAASYYDGRHPGMKELWLDADEDFLADVAHEYQYMQNTWCCEAEFAAYAKEHLVKGLKRYLPTNPQVPRHFRSVRMLELVSKPQEPTWKVPPIVHPAMHAETYDFDIRPDCSYWLSHAGFNPNYASLISLRVRLVQLHGISCPYLFTEFKRDGKSTLTVENQLATVACLALLNRFHLRLDRIAKAASSWTKTRNQEEIKMYGITFEGIEYAIWCVTPEMTAEYEWNGCSLTRIGHGNCTSGPDLRRLVGWINEIHRWGLTRHAQSCQDDIKLCLRDEDNDFEVSELLEQLEDP